MSEVRSALWKANTDKQELIMEITTIGKWKTTGEPHALSDRELEAALYAVNDLTVKEIAREMHIECGTVKARLDNARFKLGMQKSLHGLCAEIIRRGIIAPLSASLSVLLCVALVGVATTENRTAAPAQRPVISRTVRSTRNEVIYAMPA